MSRVKHSLKPIRCGCGTAMAHWSRPQTSNFCIAPVPPKWLLCAHPAEDQAISESTVIKWRIPKGRTQAISLRSDTSCERRPCEKRLRGFLTIATYFAGSSRRQLFASALRARQASSSELERPARGHGSRAPSDQLLFAGALRQVRAAGARSSIVPDNFLLPLAAAFGQVAERACRATMPLAPSLRRHG